MVTLSKWTWGILGALVTLWAVLWFTDTGCDVQLVHVGYTNSPSVKARIAVFHMTNETSGNVTRWPDMELESEPPPRVWRAEVGPVSCIQPRRMAEQHVVVPVAEGRWRMSIRCSPDGFRVALGEHLGTVKSLRTRRLLRDWLHVVPVRTISSEWVTEEGAGTNSASQTSSPPLSFGE